MNNTNYRIKEYSFRKLLKYSYKIYINKFKMIFMTILIINLPFIAIDSILKFLSTNKPVIVLVDTLELVIQIIGYLTVALIVEKSILNTQIKLKDALKKSLSKLITAIAAQMLVVLTIIPFIIFSAYLSVFAVIPFVYFIFIYHAIILRNQSVKSSLKYSIELVKGRWWKIFGITLLFVLVSFGLNKIIGLIPIDSDIVIIAFSSFIRCFIVYFYLVVQTLLFLNIDYIKEIN